MKVILLVLAGALLMACTRSEMRAFARWHATDPGAAQQFLADHPEIEAEARAQAAAPPPPPQPVRGVWDRLAQCESGGDWGISTGNGFYGGLQFTLGSWRATGGSGYPHHHSREEQIHRAEILLDMQGWGAWPACSRKLGLR